MQIGVRCNFGGRSSGDIFDEVAACLEFAIRHFTSPDVLLRYSDDLLQIVVPSEHESDAALLARADRLASAAYEVGARLGFSFDKKVGPSSSIKWLGLVVDMLTCSIALTEQRRSFLRDLVDAYLLPACVSLYVTLLESIIGHLQFASYAAGPEGLLYVASLRDGLYEAKRSGRHFVTLSPIRKEDLAWWASVLALPVIRHLLPPPAVTFDDSTSSYVDASKKGEGIYWHGRWCSRAWPPHVWAASIRVHRESMPWLELHSIATFLQTFGPEFAGRSVRIFSDCEGAVAAWNNLRSSHFMTRRLLRHIHLLCVTFSIRITLVHIPGVVNVLADHLSRLKLGAFFQACPSAMTSPTTPAPLPSHIYSP